MALPRVPPREVPTAFLAVFKRDLVSQGVPIERLYREGPLLRRPAAEMYGNHYPKLAMLHWGMTPAVEALVGEPGPLHIYAMSRAFSPQLLIWQVPGLTPRADMICAVGASVGPTGPFHNSPGRQPRVTKIVDNER